MVIDVEIKGTQIPHQTHAMVIDAKAKAKGPQSAILGQIVSFSMESDTVLLSRLRPRGISKFVVVIKYKYPGHV
jgi:hypothetical protein